MDSNDDATRREAIRQLMKPLPQKRTLWSRIDERIPSRVVAGIIALLIVVVLCSCLGYGILVRQSYGELSSISSFFCNAIATNDAPTAYTLFSDDLQQKYPLPEFTSLLQSAKITSCVSLASQSNTPAIGNKTATVTLVLTYGTASSGGSSDEQATLHLISTGLTSWRVSGLDSTALPLSA